MSTTSTHTRIPKDLLKQIKVCAYQRGTSAYKLLIHIVMRYFDDSKFSDDHETVINSDTNEISTVGKTERAKKERSELNERFKNFYAFLVKSLRTVGGSDIEVPSVPTARHEFNRVSKYSDEQIADIITSFCKTDTAKEHPTVHAALSVASINRWVVSNRKSKYFK